MSAGGFLAPRTEIRLVYQGADITRDIADYFISASYTDNSDGQVDDVTITLRDDEGLWVGSWFPSKGDKLTLDIICLHRRHEGSRDVLKCGVFTVDELSSSGPPSVFEIKAVSVPVDPSIRREKKTRAWESVTLFQIANDIAATGGLQLFYEAETVHYDRKDQSEQSDLAFLQSLCKDEGLSLKLTDNKLVVFEDKRFDQRPPITTIHRSECSQHSFTTQAHDLYSACTVTYRDAADDADLEYTFTDQNVPTGKTLNVIKRVESIAEAERLAKSRLRAANRRETTGSITIQGNPSLYAAGNVMLTGFGAFNGKYSIDKIANSVGGGFSQSLDLTLVLEDY